MGKRIRLAIHINTESRNFGGLRIVPSLVLDFDKPSTICPLSQFLSLSLYIYIYKYKYIHILHLYQASLITQLVKTLPAVQETLVQFLGQEDPLEKG